MALTTLDSQTALIVIDLQKGLVLAPTVHPIADILTHALTLAEAFRERRLPVVLVNVDGAAPGRVEQSRRRGELPPNWTELVTELNQQPSDHTVTKQTGGAFTNTDLELYLKGKGVSQVVIAGISTSFGVESTGRHAHELGFNVTFAIDAMTDLSAHAHAHSTTRIFPRIGETGTTQDIIDLLNQRGGV